MEHHDNRQNHQKFVWFLNKTLHPISPDQAPTKPDFGNILECFSKHENVQISENTQDYQRLFYSYIKNKQLTPFNVKFTHPFSDHIIPVPADPESSMPDPSQT